MSLEIDRLRNPESTYEGVYNGFYHQPLLYYTKQLELCNATLWKTYAIKTQVGLSVILYMLSLELFNLFITHAKSFED